MSQLLIKLNSNKTFKIAIALILFFFSLLVYFNQTKAAVTCTCNLWDCEDVCQDKIEPYGCKQYCTCLDPGGETCTGSCDPGTYVCNRDYEPFNGCCPYTNPPPETPIPGCDPNDWFACNPTCGDGSQVNDCGSERFCNDGPCCVPSCGGTDCGDLAAAPNKVTALQVNGALSGNLDLTSSSNLNAVWIDPGTSDPFGFGVVTNYVVQIWDKGQGTTPPYPCDATSNCSYYDTVTKTEAYTAIASADHDNDIYVAVRAINNTCVSVGYGAWSDSSSYDLVANVTGNFYNDQNPTPVGFGGSCTGDTTTSVDLSSYTGSNIVGSTGGTPGSLGTSYSLSSVPYAPSSGWNQYGFDISLTIDNSIDPLNSLTCSCPIDAVDPFLCELTDNTSPSTGNNIYLIDIDLSNGPWWQTSGGNVYGANSLTSAISDQCSTSALCDAYLITENTDNDADSAGIPLTGVSSIISGGYYTQRISSEPRALNTDHDNLIKENYAYFNRGVDLSLADTISGTITSLPTGATPDEDDTEVYYSDGDLTGDLTIDLSSTENIPSNRKIVIFINGNLTFSSTPAQMIDVDQGGFIAFISNGSITFDASVGNTDATDTTPNIAGVFVADGTINIDGYSEAPLNDDTSKDNKFVGEGTFVGWSGFNLNRDYENTTNPLQKELNNLNPIELFIFRPDFNKNIPAIMMQPSLVWQEVN